MTKGPPTQSMPKDPVFLHYATEHFLEILDSNTRLVKKRNTETKYFKHKIPHLLHKTSLAVAAIA
jgi:hypothetical protein